MSDTDIDEMGPVDYLVVEFPAGQSNFNGDMAAELASVPPLSSPMASAAAVAAAMTAEMTDTIGATTGAEPHERKAGKWQRQLQNW